MNTSPVHTIRSTIPLIKGIQKGPKLWTSELFHIVDLLFHFKDVEVIFRVVNDIVYMSKGMKPSKDSDTCRVSEISMKTHITAKNLWNSMFSSKGRNKPSSI